MSAATGYRKEPEPSKPSSVQLSQYCRHFQLFDILLATNNFDESLVIGKGGFGKVYRGTFFNGSATVLSAIKRLDRSSNQGAPEFWAEVEMLSKFRHCNLVSLFGYCNHEKEMILVYEYMPNGTLEDHLHKLGTPLSWIQRLKICIGAARGLHYLHTGTGIEVGVIHRDVKSSNILLHETWAAKISDFGLSKIGPTNQPSTGVKTVVKGTFGYLDPNYYTTGKLTRKSDVYAFGVVLLEVLCRKRAVFDIDQQAFNLAIWAQESIKVGNLKNILDPDLRGQISPKCSKDFVRITERCLHSRPKKRSTMAEVLFNLESILNLQEKLNNSVQPAGRTILDRMVNMLPFPSNGENTAMPAQQQIPYYYIGPSPSPVQSTAQVPSSPVQPTPLAQFAAVQTHTPIMQPFSYAPVLQGFQTMTFQDPAWNMDTGASSHLADNTAQGDLKPSSDGKSIIGSNTVGADNNTFLATSELPADYEASSLKEFEYDDLKKATKNFSPDMLLGEGCFGKAYLGWVDQNTFAPSKHGVGVPVAVKRYNQDGLQRHYEWQTEVSFLGLFAHPNIISLFGYCSNEHEHLLVYEYMGNKSFDGLLFTDSPEIAELLSWRTRLIILIGVARGLAYLHSLKDQVIHRDVKSRSILLDQDFNAKLGNFGFARYDSKIGEEHVSTRVMGILGYIDPEYLQTGCCSVKSDIYSFGVVLLETLTGRRTYDWNRVDEYVYLPTWASQFNRIDIKEILDPRLEQNYPEEGAFECITLALRCVAYHSKDRPSSEEVLQSLEKISFDLNPEHPQI